MTDLTMRIKASEDKTYPILIGRGLLTEPEKWLPEYLRNHRVVLITDETVRAIFGDQLHASVQKADLLLFSFIPGETSKRYATKQAIEDEMLRSRCDRQTLILALGGGVVGDMAGFIAATYMRGIPYIQIPTTLLAMVDSSVGGKTGINTAYGKNLIGAFWQPTCVVADLDCLATLSPVQMKNGLVEAIKMFLTNDEKSFQYVCDHLQAIRNHDLSVLEHIVTQAITIKANVVEQDEKESNGRMVLNFGHTIGHALERVSNYTMLHGYAVALGILVETKIAEMMGVLSTTDFETIKELFSQLGIKGSDIHPLQCEEIIEATKQDKKVKEGHVRYILLNQIGSVKIEGEQIAFPVEDAIVRDALLNICEVTDGRQ